jgi:acetolactate synthase I/II/III large subunit
MTAEPTSAIDVLLRCLEGEGVEHIFGIPGGPLTPLYEALAARGTIRHVLAKHEAGAAFMANGYARVRHGLGVCCTTSGPGGTNALTGIASSYADSVPVLLITAQVATATFGRGAAQESTPFGVDLVEIYRPITKLSTMLLNVDRTQALVQQALRTALSGRPGPVHLSLPADLVKRPAPFATVRASQYRTASRPVDRDAAAEAARLLHNAERPAILAGTGVAISGAYAELRDLAVLRSIPVATTPKGKGVFPENHPLSLGVFGFTGHPRAEAYLLSGEIDVLLTVGTSLGETATHAWDRRLAPKRALVQIDIDPRELGKNYPADLGIVGDAGATLREIFLELEELEPEEPSRSLDPLRALRQTVPRLVDPELCHSEMVPIKPHRVLQEMREALPPEALLFVDIGNSMLWAGHYYEAREAGTFFLSIGLGSMGHAIAAAVGGKVGAPDRPVVVLGGDAAFAMNGMEVHTAVELGLQVVWIILNDGGHGMVHHGEHLMRGKDLIGARFRVPLDIAGLAEAMGARGVRAASPAELRGALAEALAHPGPTVIDVRIDGDEVPRALLQRVKTLDKFFAGRIASSDSPTSIQIPAVPWSRKKPK